MPQDYPKEGGTRGSCLSSVRRAPKWTLTQRPAGGVAGIKPFDGPSPDAYSAPEIGAATTKFRVTGRYSFGSAGRGLIAEKTPKRVETTPGPGSYAGMYSSFG